MCNRARHEVRISCADPLERALGGSRTPNLLIRRRVRRVQKIFPVGLRDADQRLRCSPADLDTPALTALDLIANAETPPTSPANGPVAPAFQAKTAGVCKTAAQQILAIGAFPVKLNPYQPDNTQFPLVATWELQYLAAIRTFRAQLRALGSPSAGLSSWKQFLQHVDHYLKLSAAQQHAASRLDGPGFARTARDFWRASDANLRAAVTIGVPSCTPDAL